MKGNFVGRIIFRQKLILRNPVRIIGGYRCRLAMGSNYPRTAMNFTGTVTLHFLNTECSQGDSCTKNVVKLNSMIRSPPAMIDKHNRQTSLLNFQTLFGLLGLVFLYGLVLVLFKVRKLMRRESIRTSLDSTAARNPTYGSMP